MIVYVGKIESRIKCPRPVKNRCVNFFGETFTLGLQNNIFTIIISKITQNQLEEQIWRINVKQDTLDSTKKSKYYSAQNQDFKLQWKSKFVDPDDDGGSSDGTKKDLSDIEAQVGKFQRNSRKLTSKIYSPISSKKDINQNSSVYLRSESPNKLSKQTTNKTDSFKIDFNQTKKRVKTKSLSKNQQKMKNKIPNKANKISNKLTIKKSKSSLLQRLEFKQLAFVGLIGAITGLSAAHGW